MNSEESDKALYALLVSLLLKCPQAIEILPGDASIWMQYQPEAHIEPESSLSPFLFTENNLGIPQRILYKVYHHAVGVFKSARNCVPARSTIADVQLDHDTDGFLIHALVASSSILVLANPSHQTALNARKCLIRMHLIDPHAELCFIASLLSSQHCAKHAELWYHRRWLLSAVYDPHLPIATDMSSCPGLQFASREALQNELDVISRACELYPRNYFAWTHRLMCMRSLLSDYLAGTDTVDFVLVFQHEVTRVKEWIERHLSDYSAIHFILALSQAAFQSGDSSLVEILIKENPLDQAIFLVQYYPTHEALWMYIWTVLCITNSWPTQQVQQFIDQFVYPLAHLQCPKVNVDGGLTKPSQYARWFLERKIYSKPSHTS